MESQCEKVERLIVDYAVGELDSAGTELVEEHVQSCAACARALGEVRRIVSAFSEERVVEPSEAVCRSVKEAAWEGLLGRRGAFSSLIEGAGSLVRRPVLVGASALAVIGAVILLGVLPERRTPERPPGSGPAREVAESPSDRVQVGMAERILAQLKDYLKESRQVMKALGGPDAGNVLATYDWKTWAGQAMAMKEMKEFEAYYPLFEELEGLYREIEACGGIFGEQQIGRIRQFMSEKRLSERVERAANRSK